MDHPFEVGEEYRNSSGIYEVLSIDESKMRVRYADGREETHLISTQVLAWGMWQDVPEPPPPVVTKSTPRKGRQHLTQRRGYKRCKNTQIRRTTYNG